MKRPRRVRRKPTSCGPRPRPSPGCAAWARRSLPRIRRGAWCSSCLPRRSPAARPARRFPPSSSARPRRPTWRPRWQALYRAVRPALETARENQVPPLRIVDGVLQQSQITVEGDATAGFRVRVSGEQLNDSIWQVVMEQGRARLLPPGARGAQHASGDQASKQPGLGRRGCGQREPADAGRRLVGGQANERGKRRLPARRWRPFMRSWARRPRPWRTSAAPWRLRGERTAEADWYVLGRIAEQYGLDEVAAGLYRKVPARQAAVAECLCAGAAKVEEGGEVVAHRRPRVGGSDGPPFHAGAKLSLPNRGQPASGALGRKVEGVALAPAPSSPLPTAFSSRWLFCSRSICGIAWLSCRKIRRMTMGQSDGSA